MNSGICVTVVMDPVNSSGDEGFSDEEVAEDNAMETAISAEGEDELLESSSSMTYFYADNNDPSQPGYVFTKGEIEKVMCLEPYQRKLGTCHMCGKCWYDNQVTTDCAECGGHSMERSCPVCEGRCGVMWARNAKASHTFHKAHWEGACKLPADVQQAFLRRYKPDGSSDDTLVDVMQDLSTS